MEGFQNITDKNLVCYSYGFKILRGRLGEGSNSERRCFKHPPLHLCNIHTKIDIPNRKSGRQNVHNCRANMV